MSKIKVLLIDDHAVMRMGLVSLLGISDEIEVVGDAGDGESGIAKALETKPDVAIVDLMMPKMDGAETTQKLLEKIPTIKVLILTSYSSADGIAHALKSGALGVTIKTADAEELISAIKTVAKGRQSIPSDIKRLLSEDPPVPTLSMRQTEILQSITRGLSNADIAKELGLSVGMVKLHVNALLTKIGAANRAEAVAIALRKHLLKI